MNKASAIETAVREAGLAWRALRRSPGITLMAVLPIALAIGIGTCMFSLVEGVLLKPLPYPRAAELFDVRVMRPNEQDRWGLRDFDGHLSQAAFDAWANRGSTITALASYDGALSTVQTPDGPVRVPSAAVSPNLFDTLGAHAALGRLFLPTDLPPRNVVVLSAGLWRERFGSAPNIVGRSVTINDQPCTVLGVAADDFYFPSRETTFWTVGPTHDNALARLKPGVSKETAEAEATAIAANADGKMYVPGDASTSGPGHVELVTILDRTTGSVRQALLVLMASSLVLLVVASANVAGLLLVRSMRRHRERAVRAALGASTWRLAREAFLENALIGLAGGLVGLALAAVLHHWQARFIPAGLPRRGDVTLDWHVVLFSGLASLSVAVLSSLLPVWRAARPDLRNMIQAPPGSSSAVLRRRGREWAQGGLLAGQVGLSCALLIASGLLVRSFLNLTAVDPGYSPGGVLTAQIGFPASMTQADRRDFSAHLLDRLHDNGTVVAAGVTSSLPLEQFTVIYTLDDGHGPTIRMALRIVSPGYLDAIGAHLLAGRPIDDGDTRTSPPVVLVNETFARRYFTNRTPIGAPLPGTEKRPMTIVGLVKDMHDDGPATGIEPTMYMPFVQATQSTLFNRVDVAIRTTGAPAAFAPALRSITRGLDDRLPTYGIQTLTDAVSDAVSRPRLYAVVMALLACFTMGITGIGLYGTLAHEVGRRRRELAIRIALGARARSIVWIVVRDVAIVIGAGLALGLAVGLGGSRLMSSLLFGLAPADPLTFAAAAFVVIGAAAGAFVGPIRRALRFDPAQALRAD